MKKERKLLVFIFICSFILAPAYLLTRNPALIKEMKEQRREKRIVSRVVNIIQKEVSNADRQTLEQVVTAIYRVSKKKGVDYRIILALAKIESNFRRDAVSPKGARGLLQIKPSVARMVCENLGMKIENIKNLHDLETNITIGTHILSSLIDEYYDIHGALSAYNMGQTRLLELSVRDYRTKFSKAVLREYKRYIEVLPDP